ncbi:MAG: 6-phosphogluconolactonase [Candidatus Bipolaricaulota bacterium]
MRLLVAKYDRGLSESAARLVARQVLAEPGTPFESRVHVAKLSDTTRRQAAQDFDGVGRVPCWAITVGIKTIMHARGVLLVASGEGKADVLARALQGPVTIELPASVLQLHRELTVVADAEAVADLREGKPLYGSPICSRSDRGR